MKFPSLYLPRPPLHIMSKSTKKAGGLAKVATVKEQPQKDRGPLMISIGPMCAGKTSFISGLGENNLSDIAIDDAPQVYEKIPLSSLVNFLEPSAPGVEKPAPYADKKTYGKSTIARILEAKESEQMILACLFSGAIDLVDAEARLKSLGCSASFISTVRDLKVGGNKFSSTTVDVYIPEAISFGVQQYLKQLESAAKNAACCVVSGNCNLKTENYAEALTAAFNNRRRVRFLRWGSELPAVPIEELMRRNVTRFLKTGRYVPSVTIVGAVQSATDIMAAGSTHSALATAAGFTMNAEGYVYPSGLASTELPGFPDVSSSKWTAWFEGTETVFNLKSGSPVVTAGEVGSAPVPVPAPIPAPVSASAPAPASAPQRAATSHPASSATEMLKAAVSKIESESTVSETRRPVPAPAPAAAVAPVAAPAPPPAPAATSKATKGARQQQQQPAAAPLEPHKHTSAKNDAPAENHSAPSEAGGTPIHENTGYVCNLCSQQ